MRVDDARRHPHTGRVDDRKPSGIQPGANRFDTAVAHDDISAVEPLAGAGQERSALQDGGFGRQRSVGARERRRTIVNAIFAGRQHKRRDQ